jgi:hypothetical protein
MPLVQNPPDRHPRSPNGFPAGLRFSNLQPGQAEGLTAANGTWRSGSDSHLQGRQICTGTGSGSGGLAGPALVRWWQWQLPGEREGIRYLGTYAGKVGCLAIVVLAARVRIVNSFRQDCKLFVRTT